MMGWRVKHEKEKSNNEQLRKRNESYQIWQVHGNLYEENVFALKTGGRKWKVFALKSSGRKWKNKWINK